MNITKTKLNKCMKMRKVHSTTSALEITLSSTTRGLRKLALVAVAALVLQNTAKAEGIAINKSLLPNLSKELKHPTNVSETVAKTVTGLVLDDTGLPLPGATIAVKGTKTKTVTSAEGKFTLNVPDNAAILVVSYIGMESQEVDISNLTNVTITLKPSGNANLTEVVVTALGVNGRKEH